MLHVVCSGLYMHINYVCVCVCVCWGWCLRQSALNFLGGRSKWTISEGAGVIRSKCLTLLHMYIALCLVTTVMCINWGEPEQAYIVDCSIAAIIISQ